MSKLVNLVNLVRKSRFDEKAHYSPGRVTRGGTLFSKTKLVSFTRLGVDYCHVHNCFTRFDCFSVNLTVLLNPSVCPRAYCFERVLMP